MYITDHGQKEEEGRDEECGEGEVTVKPKKKRPPKKTVEQNLSNINSTESERKCLVRKNTRASKLFWPHTVLLLIEKALSDTL